MKLIEADGKKILKEAGIAIPMFSKSWNEVVFPAYIKAQVLHGRRGQRGLVQRCGKIEDAESTTKDFIVKLSGLDNAAYIWEQEIPHVSEWLVAIHLDTEQGGIVVSFSDKGGMDVSEADTRMIASEEDIEKLGLPAGVKNTLKKMYVAFFKQDCIHLEINPLAVLDDGSCVALDAKVELDDAALFRHPEWDEFCWLSKKGKRLSDREEEYVLLLESSGHRGTLGRYVELDGDIAMILSGGGASLVAIDALIAAGGSPANYVEMSGNPDPDMVRKASNIVFSKPGLNAVWIAGSFANFTDIQFTVNAVLDAMRESGLRVPVVIRRDGPSADLAKADAEKWGKDLGIPVRFDRADVDLDMSAKFLPL